MPKLLFSDLLSIGGRVPQPEKPWIMHVPVISGAHLPRTELDVLDEMRSEGWFVLANPTGRQVSGPWAVVVATDPSDREGDMWDAVPVLQVLLGLLHEVGFHHVRIDAECGDVFADLPNYHAKLESAAESPVLA